MNLKQQNSLSSRSSKSTPSQKNEASFFSVVQEESFVEMPIQFEFCYIPWAIGSCPVQLTKAYGMGLKSRSSLRKDVALRP